jgi:hypothetical protein
VVAVKAESTGSYRYCFLRTLGHSANITNGLGLVHLSHVAFWRSLEGIVISICYLFLWHGLCLAKRSPQFMQICVVTIDGLCLLLLCGEPHVLSVYFFLIFMVVLAPLWGPFCLQFCTHSV